eukprot:scaffold2308_cov164-Ochromonas_danica.AAC.9
MEEERRQLEARLALSNKGKTNRKRKLDNEDNMLSSCETQHNWRKVVGIGWKKEYNDAIVSQSSIWVIRAWVFE